MAMTASSKLRRIVVVKRKTREVSTPNLGRRIRLTLGRLEKRRLNEQMGLGGCLLSCLSRRATGRVRRVHLKGRGYWFLVGVRIF